MSLMWAFSIICFALPKHTVTCHSHFCVLKAVFDALNPCTDVCKIIFLFYYFVKEQNNF